MAALASGSGPAFAADDPAAANLAPLIDPATPQAQPGTATSTPDARQALLPAASVPGFAGSEAVDIERLAAMRGGEETNESNTSVDGSVHDNTADHVVSGSNSINGEAFSNASGLNTVIQNSGSNVLIQNGMSIQVIFANPGQ
ncbi:hypothetical protein CSC65_01120 [Pseudoxanthomonas daejeonensis]|uniref:Uncharacterized protein n=2 Tax=Pseudoxanthomonas daejeonensis TaxID=266062 RepID=A0ABQ6ZBU8_9GAMM|nr:hypothetical protein CSC65_01120 [Pseudoxanthomonas daejeonensis]